jgi:membrane protein implicated in regulation of membrane protease activity
MGTVSKVFKSIFKGGGQLMLILKDMEFMDWTMVVFWAVIFVITLIIELETADLTTIWFCISSVVALVAGIAFANPITQIIIFVALSLVLILATRPLVKNKMRATVIRTNTDRLIGMVAIVTKEIVPNEIGEVKVSNEFWRAVNYDGLSFEVGESISVDSITGIKLVVSKLDGNSNIEIIKNS